jgi:uncharacterized protein
MTAVQTRPTLTRASGSSPRRRRPGPVPVLVVLVVLAIVARDWLLQLFSSPRAETFATVAAAVLVQGLPFVAAGTFVAAALRAFVPVGLLDRALTGNPVGAVVVAALAGVVLPVGGDAAADAAAGQLRRGTAPAAALTYLLAAPALSPVVLVATVVAFPDEPAMVFARAAAGLALAILVGCVWLRPGRPAWLNLGPPGISPPSTWDSSSSERPTRERPTRERPTGEPLTGERPTDEPLTDGPPAADSPAAPDEGAERGWPAFWSICRRDLVRAGGLLTVGALAVASVSTVVPASWPVLVAARPVFAVATLALVAVLLSVPAEADAFVAAGLTAFPLTARLVFLTVSPVVNLRTFGRHTDVFGPRFAVRLAPVAFVATVLLALLAAGLLR